MVVMKYDMANNEQFITPVRGLYSDYVISVKDFKDRNARIMKNCLIDTSHGDKGEKIHELFDPESDGEIVKESMQQWLSDNRHEITQCIGIALRNHITNSTRLVQCLNVSSILLLGSISITAVHCAFDNLFTKCFCNIDPQIH